MDITCTPVFGYVKLCEKLVPEDGELVYYGWSEHYDENGALVKKTEPTALGRMFWEKAPSMSFIDRLIDFFL